MLSNRHTDTHTHTQTHRPSTVTLAAHARRGLKMLKDVGMACQKVCKQGRDDIIVKVNLQSPIPTFFCTTVAN